MNNLKKIMRWMIHWLGNGLRGIQYIYLRMAGVRIGRNTMISLHAKIDVRRGQVIIGDNCHITYGCVILSHDYAARILGKEKDPEAGKVIIGNNVFIGVNSVILPNVTIGDNSIIGAGSVVNCDIPPKVVAAGNPIKILKYLN
jgi:acetyltransferase-like isoleucine patch superfamily enzyme